MEYTIGQAAEAAGLTAYTLRYYEKEGLLPEIQRNEKGVRVYRENDIFWIDLIRCFRDTGMSISDIKYIVDLSQDGDHTISERKQILKEHKKKIEIQISQLKKYLYKIDKKLEWYDGKANGC